MCPTTVLEEENAQDKAVFYAFDEARAKLEQSGAFEPFTVILAGEELYVESHNGEDAAQCFNSARQTVVQMSNLASAYVFCYDGYVTTDEGVRDAIVAERASKGDELGEAFGLIYEVDESGEGAISYDEEVYALGEATSLFTAGEFSADELEELDENGYPIFADDAECGCGCGDGSGHADGAVHGAAADGSECDCGCGCDE